MGCCSAVVKKEPNQARVHLRARATGSSEDRKREATELGSRRKMTRQMRESSG